MTDTQLSEITGYSKGTINKWRLRWNLRKNERRNVRINMPLHHQEHVEAAKAELIALECLNYNGIMKDSVDYRIKLLRNIINC